MRIRIPVLAAAAVMAIGPIAGAQSVFQTINGSFSPGGPNCCYWTPSDIGWYWTPSSNVDLRSVQTQLYDGNGNINNNFTLTTTVYTDRPAVGGTALGSASENAAGGGWVGGVFANAISLSGGTSYFIGFSGWDQALTANGGGGINWIAGSPAGAQSLAPGYDGVDYADVLGPNAQPANTDLPVLQFIQQNPVTTTTPEPGTFMLVGTGLSTLFVGVRRKWSRIG